MTDNMSSTTHAVVKLTKNHYFRSSELSLENVQSYDFKAVRSLNLGLVSFCSGEVEDLFLEKLFTSSIETLNISSSISPEKIYKVLHVGNISRTLVDLDLSANLMRIERALLSKALEYKPGNVFKVLSIGHPNASTVRTAFPKIYRNVRNTETLIVNHGLEPVDCLSLLRNSIKEEDVLREIQFFPDFGKRFSSFHWKLPLYLVHKLNVKVWMHFFSSSSGSFYFTKEPVVEYMKAICGSDLKLTGTII